MTKVWGTPLPQLVVPIVLLFTHGRMKRGYKGFCELHSPHILLSPPARISNPPLGQACVGAYVITVGAVEGVAVGAAVTVGAAVGWPTASRTTQSR